MKCFGRAGPNRRPAMVLGRSSTGCTNMWSRPRSTTAPWKESTIIAGNVVEEITKLKQQPGKDIIIDGSATLVQSLMGTDLIDEYRFLVEPFIMGKGKAVLPGRDASDEAEACRKQNAQFWNPCSCLPARQKITAWFCAKCSGAPILLYSVVAVALPATMAGQAATTAVQCPGDKARQQPHFCVLKISIQAGAGV